MPNTVFNEHLAFLRWKQRKAEEAQEKAERKAKARRR